MTLIFLCGLGVRATWKQEFTSIYYDKIIPLPCPHIFTAGSCLRCALNVCVANAVFCKKKIKKKSLFYLECSWFKSNFTWKVIIQDGVIWSSARRHSTVATSCLNRSLQCYLFSGNYNRDHPEAGRCEPTAPEAKLLPPAQRWFPP